MQNWVQLTRRAGESRSWTEGSCVEIGFFGFLAKEKIGAGGIVLGRTQNHLDLEVLFFAFFFFKAEL